MIQGLPKYRLWRNRPDGKQVLLRERLMMDRPLTLAVVTGSPADDPMTTSGEQG
ncbi:hypothetical protein QCD58_005223 [Enterobacter hormaechei]|nr:hypothetical protein [Enterobacter hormaechei]EKS6646255.1 hypothetical protein [Enterobacter hormaechei]